MKIYRISTLLALLILTSTSAMASGVSMVSQFPPPQVWIDALPGPSGSINATPVVDVYMRLENNTYEPIVYTFASSQTFDIYIKDNFGNILSQWSRNKFFLPAFTTITIPPGGSQTFGGSVELTTADGQFIYPGDYELSITLTKSLGVSPASKMPLRIDWAF